MRLLMKSAASAAAMSVFIVACGSGGDEGAKSSGAVSDAAEAKAESSKDSKSASDAGPMIVDDVDADIFGVKLGMTPEEAKAALEENKPEYWQGSALVYNTLEQQMGLTDAMFKPTAETPGAFVGTTSLGRGSDRVHVYFALPPAENVVQSVERKENIRGDTSVDVYRQALVDKYGEPDEVDEAGAVMLLKWLYNGKDCNPLASNLPATKYQHWPTDAASIPHSPRQCGTALIYSLTAPSGDIVSNVEAKLGNVGQIYLNREATIAFRDEIQKKAQEERVQQATDAPDL
ncbi:hypothetical protein [Hyphococcus sp.]|uniref:hypothetical protein n=1 Tax=Hyphococcus sp. TaxID=2038636 RepID=UPI0035C68129